MRVWSAQFSTSMARAVLEDRKTQMRRVITKYNALLDGHLLRYTRRYWDGLDWDQAFVDPGPSPAGNEGPYLKVPFPAEGSRHRIYPKWSVGDRLWVREAWGVWPGTLDEERLVLYRATCPDCPDGWRMERGPIREFVRWRPSIHMPRWASRLALELTSIRPERVQEIDADDALAEGVRDAYPSKALCPETIDEYNIERFRRLWDSINAKRGHVWDANPWVWVHGFKRIQIEALADCAREIDGAVGEPNAETQRG